MIRYSLECAHDHVFEQWFDNMADYDAKAETKGLSCPECGDTQVHKTLMAPNIGGPKAPVQPAAPCGAPACASGLCPSMMG
ncbi:MAG: DUF1178 family protein [Rhodospirillum sp.]|nr:DUF1178 family protein [Rhodospirillum sp.]MCF8487652.1 DUF1178 family protein [Rhodospirillum sp.]MCF8502743.1 DUF1178 family protein [Rhodospirillum sp.]